MKISDDAQSAEENGHRSMSLRLPRPMHEAMKGLAARRGSKAADFYVETVETFIRDHMAGDVPLRISSMRS